MNTLCMENICEQSTPASKEGIVPVLTGERKVDVNALAELYGSFVVLLVIAVG